MACFRPTADYTLVLTEREVSSPLGAQLPWCICFESGAHNRGAIVSGLSTSAGLRAQAIRNRVQVGDALLRVQRAGVDDSEEGGALDESVAEVDFYGNLAAKLASEYDATRDRPLRLTFRCAQECEGETRTIEYPGLPTELALAPLDDGSVFLAHSPAEIGRVSAELDPPLRLVSINGRRIDAIAAGTSGGGGGGGGGGSPPTPYDAARRAQQTFARAAGSRHPVQLRFEVPIEQRRRALRLRVAACLEEAARIRDYGSDDGSERESAEASFSSTAAEEGDEEGGTEDGAPRADGGRESEDERARAEAAERAAYDAELAEGGDDDDLGAARAHFGKRVLFGSFARSGLKLRVEYHIHHTPGHHAGWRTLDTARDQIVGEEAECERPEAHAHARLVVDEQRAPPNPWEVIGLRPGDLLVAIDGTPIGTTQRATQHAAQHAALRSAEAIHALLAKNRSTCVYVLYHTNPTLGPATPD